MSRRRNTQHRQPDGLVRFVIDSAGMVRCPDCASKGLVLRDPFVRANDLLHYCRQDGTLIRTLRTGAAPSGITVSTAFRCDDCGSSWEFRFSEVATGAGVYFDHERTEG